MLARVWLPEGSYHRNFFSGGAECKDMGTASAAPSLCSPSGAAHVKYGHSKINLAHF